MKKIAKAFIPLLILGLAISVFVVMKKTKPEQPPVEIKEKVWMVNSQTIALESLPSVQTLYGVVESNSMVQAAAPVAAVVEEVKVLPGDFVKQGQVMLALSKVDLQLPVAQAKADKIDAQSQIELQKMMMLANEKRLEHEQRVLGLKQEALQRAHVLLKKNLASQSVVDAANEALVKQEYVVVGAQLSVQQGQAQLNQLQARLQKASLALEQAQLNAERGVLVAPFDARVAEVNVSQGDRVTVGKVMVSFYGLQSLELRAKLPITALQQAQNALSKGKVLSAMHSKEAEQAERLTLLRLAGEASTSGVDAYFSLPDSLRSKRPGELMEVYFQGEAFDQVAVVPFSAVYGNNLLYVIKDSRLQGVEVSLKGEVIRDGKLMALVSSAQLQAGDQVMVTHLPNAITGLKVTEVR